MGVSRIGLYLDLEKFCDNISLARLMWAAEGLGYPRTELILITQVYLAPRVVRVGEAYATTGAPTTGVVPGSGQANHAARAMLYDILEHTHQVPPHSSNQGICG